jgi:hypothetical protein
LNTYALIETYITLGTVAVNGSNRMSTKRKSKQMYLVDLAEIVSKSATLDGVLNETHGLWSALYEEMDPTETLWVFARNEQRDGQFWPVAMSIGDHVKTESELVLKNIITVHRNAGRDGDLRTAYEEILFFVKDTRRYQFNKDEIRIAHVYQGKEWSGDRKEGQSAYHDTAVQRYNPDGKDPGNVWLTEIRNETADEAVDETQPMRQTEALKRCLQAGSSKGETVHAFWLTDKFAAVVEEQNRVLNRRDEAIERVVQ